MDRRFISRVAMALLVAVFVVDPVLASAESTAKVLVFNAQAQVIAVFTGTYAPGATDPGSAMLQSTTPVAVDGKPTELFVPVRIASAVWIWDEARGYRLLANLAPGDSERTVELDAGEVDRSQTAAAWDEPGDFSIPSREPIKGGHTVKVLVFNGLWGEVIAVFHGLYVLGPNANDPGIAFLESTTPAALDSKVTELFVPVGMPSAVWIWREVPGYRFLTNLFPTDAAPPIELDSAPVE